MFFCETAETVLDPRLHVVTVPMDIELKTRDKYMTVGSPMLYGSIQLSLGVFFQAFAISCVFILVLKPSPVTNLIRELQ